jgi:predicted phosphate transport protein (TIGR00153 family)
MNNSFFNRFTPKEPKFFPLLKQLSDVIMTASELLIECVKSDSHAEKIDFYKKIKEQERLGDKLSNRIFNELNTTFITPFDREDINHLANRLDDVIDSINSSVKRIAIYKPKRLPDTAVLLSKLVNEAAVYIGKAVDELDVLKKNAENVKEYCRQLHDVENKADDVYEHFVIQLFEEEKDGIEIIKLKEIMYELEKTTNITESVGKIIKTIIVKYA